LKRIKFFPTYREAKKFLKECHDKGIGESRDWNIFDLKKNFPRRKKTRYFVGSYIEWLNI